MKSILILLAGWCLFGQVVKAQQPPVLQGQVRYFLSGEVAISVPIRLLEPGVEGATSRDGTFRIQLPSGWDTGYQVTLFIEGYEVIIPWFRKVTIQKEAEKKLEFILIAKLVEADVLRNQAELARILRPAIESRGKQKLVEAYVLRNQAEFARILRFVIELRDEQ